jgi:hypothetical protein
LNKAPHHFPGNDSQAFPPFKTFPGKSQHHRGHHFRAVLPMLHERFHELGKAGNIDKQTDERTVNLCFFVSLFL